MFKRRSLLRQDSESSQSGYDLQGKLKAAASAVAKTWALLTPIYGNRHPVPIISAYALSSHPLTIALLDKVCPGDISLLAFAPQAPQGALRR